MTDVEFQQAKAANDEAARMQKQTYNEYKAMQSKLALAANRFRIAHGEKEYRTADVDQKYFVKNQNGVPDILLTVKKDPSFFAQYRFSAAEANQMFAKAQEHTGWVYKHNQTSDTYWAEEQKRETEAEEKSRQSIKAKMQKSQEALASATATPQHKNTMVLRTETDWGVNERKVDIKTGEIVSSHTEYKDLRGVKPKSSDSQGRDASVRQSESGTKADDAAAEKERQKQDRERQKEEKKKKREAEKAEKAKQRAEAKKKRDAIRQQNQQEYEEKLAEYKKQRAEEKDNAKKQREEEAKKRHDEYVKQRNEIGDQATKDGQAGYKAINDYTYSAVEAYKQQEADGGYKGTSAQAKQELKNSLKDIWNLSTDGAQKELSEAYTGISSSVDTLKNAKDTVSGIYKDALSQGINIYTNTASLAYQAAVLNTVDKDATLDIQKQILAQKLTDRMIMDQIVDNVQNQMLTLKDAGTAIRNTYLIQRAYVAAYVKQTFGNPQFIANVTKVVSLKVDNYVEAMANEKVTEIDNKIDSAFTKVNNKVDKVSTQIISYLDKAEKIDIISKMNSELDKITSIQDTINKKIEKFNNSPVGIFLSPLLTAVSVGVSANIKVLLSASRVTNAIAKVKDKIVSLQQNIAKAKEFVQQKVQMVKDYIDNLKKKAEEAVKKFADKIVADITSKISSALGGLAAKNGAKF